jgi:AcrR family transcriptional regulator
MSNLRYASLPMKAPTPHSGERSPNQLEKQRQIVEAARTVLARDGLAACTARAVADESPLTKSAIHYYFDTIEEIIDRAMEAHIVAFVEQLRQASSDRDEPVDRLWSTLESYLKTFEERPTIATLWFGYWVSALEDGRRQPVERMQDKIVDLLAELLAAADCPDAEARARALFSYLVGTVMRQAVRPAPFSELQPELAALCGLPPAALTH